MGNIYKAVRGMHDLVPDQSKTWRTIESALNRIMISYGYQEIRFPILEKTNLFQRSIGEITDIVEKEMYTFDDKNGDSLTLRPEGTASCVRACLENGLLHNQTQRLWYMGPMFRRERPQKGRYRQFHQLGVETFGINGVDIEAELILMGARIWKALGITDIELQLNSLGSPESRSLYSEELIKYFDRYKNDLDKDSQIRLNTSPLRVLDSKVEKTQEIVEGAPLLSDFLDKKSAQQFEDLLGVLDALSVGYVVNSKLVRGLDYYRQTVFEWVTDKLGAQATVCAGGRYDGLVENLGGKSTPAVGFAIGIERLILLSSQYSTLDSNENPSVYVVMDNDLGLVSGLKLAEVIREKLELSVKMNAGGGSIKSQMKKADKSGARLALILGSNEIEQGTISVKDLRGQAEQKTCSMDNVLQFLESFKNLERSI